MCRAERTRIVDVAAAVHGNVNTSLSRPACAGRQEAQIGDEDLAAVASSFIFGFILSAAQLGAETGDPEGEELGPILCKLLRREMRAPSNDNQLQD